MRIYTRSWGDTARPFGISLSAKPPDSAHTHMHTAAVTERSRA